MCERELHLKSLSSAISGIKEKHLVRDPMGRGEVAPPSPLAVGVCLMHKTIWPKIHHVRVAGGGGVGYHGALLHDG